MKMEHERQKCVVLRLIAEINAIRDLPSLLYKAREINAHDARVLRTRNTLFGLLYREYVNTRSWRIVVKAIEKKCKALVNAKQSVIILQHLREILNLKT